MTEKKAGRPKGSRNKLITNTTKMAQEATLEGCSYPEMLKELMTVFYAPETKAADKIKIFNDVWKILVLPANVPTTEDGEVIDHSLLMEKLINKLN